MLLIGALQSYIQCTSIGENRKGERVFRSQICSQSLECVEADNKLVKLDDWKHTKQLLSCSAFKSEDECSEICDRECIH